MTTTTRQGAPSSGRPAVHARLELLRRSGVSIWLDDLSRELLESGNLEYLINEFGVTGATSNPTIFERALASSGRYDDQLRTLEPGDPAEAFLELALDDVREAADLLRDVHENSAGSDGFVSFECTPELAHDTTGTVRQALDLWKRLDRPNVMIKVPATEEGVLALEELTARGVNVNMTLLFSVERYDQVIDAYMRGLERRLREALPLDRIASVASFFVSRVDVKANAKLPPGSSLAGLVGVANARRAYGLQRERFGGRRWARLEARGARRQRPLWASTAPKDAHTSDVFYVEELVTAGAVNTMTEATLRAFADHGEIREPTATPLLSLGLGSTPSELEQEGIAAFTLSYERLLSRIAQGVTPTSP